MSFSPSSPLGFFFELNILDEVKTINWAAIETDFRLGVKSTRQIAAEHGITEAPIRKRAKKLGWLRDLELRIKAETQKLICKDAVRPVRPEKASNKTQPGRVPSVQEEIDEERIIEANATLAKDVLLRHRCDIKRIRDVLMGQVSELEYAADDGLNLNIRTKAVKAVSDTLKNLVGMEREAYGIDSRYGTDEEAVKVAVADPMETARRIAFVLAQATNKEAI